MICSTLHGLIFEEYLTTDKYDQYDLMCPIQAHKKKKNHSTSTNLLMMRQEVVVPEHLHQTQQK